MPNSESFEIRIEGKVDDLCKRFGKVETSIALHKQSIDTCNSQRKKLFEWMDGKEGLVAKVANLERTGGIKRGVWKDVIQLIILSCIVAGAVFGAVRMSRGDVILGG